MTTSRASGGKKSGFKGARDYLADSVAKATESVHEAVSSGVNQASRMTKNGSESLIDAAGGIADLGTNGLRLTKGVVTTVAKDPTIVVTLVTGKASSLKQAVATIVEDRNKYAQRAQDAAIGAKDSTVSAIKNPVDTAKTAWAISDGFKKGLVDSAKSVSGHLLVGKVDFRELNAKIYVQCEEYRTLGHHAAAFGNVRDGSTFLDAILVGGDARGVALAGYIPSEVLEAYSLQYPGQMIGFKEKIQEFSEQQIRGLVSGVKGKLFEIQYVDRLNSGVLPDGFHAEMAKSATQPGWDISISGPDPDMLELIQLKATDSVAYVKRALARYPEISVGVPTETHSELMMRGYSEQVIDSGITYEDLEGEMQAAQDAAQNGFGTPSVLMLALLAFSSYSDHSLSAYERSRSFGSRSGSYMLAYFAGTAADLVTGGIPVISIVASATARTVIGSGDKKLRTRDAMRGLIVSNEIVLKRLRERKRLS